MKTQKTGATAVASKMKDGDLNKLAASTNFSISHICNVIKGRRNNDTILKAAEKLTRRRK